MRELYEKIKESLVSALSITLIVYLLALTPWFNLTGTELLTFTISAVMLVVGLGLFSMGADLAMTPMGTHVGSGLSKQRKLGLLLVAMTPLITIQLLGFKAVITQHVRERRAMKRILGADDQQIINFM